MKSYIEDIVYVSKMTKVEKKKLRIFITVILSNLTAATDIGIILIFTSIISNSFKSENILSFLIDIFLNYKFLIPLLILFRFLILFAQTYNMKGLEMSIERNLKVYLLSEVFERGNFSIADAYFYTNQLAGHVTFFYGALTGILNVSIQIVGFTIYLIIADAQMLFYFLAGIVLLFYPLKKILVYSRELTDKSYWKNQEFSYDIQKIIENMFLIKILNKQNQELSNFKRTATIINNLQLQTTVIGQVIGYLPTFVTLFVLGILVNSPAIVALITFDFIAVMLRLFQSIGSFTSSLTGLVNSQVHLRHFNNFDKNKLKDNRENYIVKSKESENIISINNMSFKYFNSETLIFNNTSIKIRKGEHTIITGPNGSGKSTLLGLIAGVLYPTNGNIEISTRNLGYIGATPLIFTESLKYNLLYGTDKNIDDKKLLEKLKDFEVFKEESGYDLERTITNKTLSSGQMQKVAFIRALISDVEILLLDESTANLDDDSKDKIFSILSDKNITIINSTHDPDSFVNIDNHLKIDIVDEERILKFN